MAKKSSIRAEIAIRQIDELINRAESISALSYKDSGFITWRDEVRATIQAAFDMPQMGIFNAEFWNIFHLDYPKERIGSKMYMEMISNAVSKLNACRKALMMQCESPSLCSKEESSLDKVITICNRFKRMALTLGERCRNREPLIMKDEYDVQYLMKCLLSLHFDKISTEEPVPSCASKKLRIDFLIKDEKIAIEVKTTLTGASPSQLQTQLYEDIACYPKHHGVKSIVCFVYDPGCIIQQKEDFVDEINSKSDNNVKICTVVCQ